MTDCEFAKQYLKCRIAGITFVDEFLNNLESTTFPEDNKESLTSKDDFESIDVYDKIQVIYA